LGLACQLGLCNDRTMKATGGALSCAPDIGRADVKKLKVGNTVRGAADDLDHIRSLAEDRCEWAPILVRGSDGVIVDGVYRYRAALARGDKSLDVEYFEGDDSELFIESVRRNVRHGKPLTLAEKRSAAVRILVLRPGWSDRWIAEMCALSPKTVSALRRRSGQAVVAVDRRLGRDGRTRRLQRAPKAPVVSRVDGGGGDRPGGVETCPVTPIPLRRHQPRQSKDGGLAPSLGCAPARRAPEGSASSDMACLSAEDGEKFCAWFDRGQLVEDDIYRFVTTVPLSRVYAIADEARRRSQLWLAFAEQLERRVDPHFAHS
jgi:hypothetical protein